MTFIQLPPVQKKIRESGPFGVPAITPEYPLLAHLLAHAIQHITELPDFSDDTKIAVVSGVPGNITASEV